MVKRILILAVTPYEEILCGTNMVVTSAACNIPMRICVGKSGMTTNQRTKYVC